MSLRRVNTFRNMTATRAVYITTAAATLVLQLLLLLLLLLLQYTRTHMYYYTFRTMYSQRSEAFLRRIIVHFLRFLAKRAIWVYFFPIVLAPCPDRANCFEDTRPYGAAITTAAFASATAVHTYTYVLLYIPHHVLSAL